MSTPPGNSAVHTWAIPAPPHQRRKWHNKVFSGCSVCKRRRLKCGEEKPSCARCIRSKLSCSYRPRQTWIFEPSPASQHLSAPRAPPSLAESGAASREILFYQERAAPVFAAYFAAEFWSETVLQISQSEPLVRRTLATASALVEGLQTPSPDLCRSFFQSYNKVIKSIIDPAQPHSIESLMTACSLFARFELCLGSVDVAATHVRAGLHIARGHLQQLSKAGRSCAPEGRFLMDHILPVLAAFALQARIYGSDVLSNEEIAELSDEKYAIPQMPSVFVSPPQAHHCLAGIIRHFVLVEDSIGCAWDWQFIRVLANLLVKWTLALDAYESQLNSQQQEIQRPAINILRCNRQLAVCLMKRLTWESSETTEDSYSFSTDVGNILSQYKAYHISESLQAGKVASSELEVLPLLFIIATGSSQNEVRDEALGILAGLNRREIKWSSQDALEAAKVIIAQSQRSSEQGFRHVPLRTCLHVASLQWPLGQVLKWLGSNRIVDFLLENCPCRLRLRT